jgi:hypothetical protein
MTEISELTHPEKVITVSIVSHGQISLILPLLSQLDSYCHSSIEKVILTFNIPEEDLTFSNQYRFKLERIYNASTKGFGANHNSAFNLCKSSWFLVLNPDIRLDSDVPSKLVKLADSDSALLAPRIFEPGRRQPEQHRAMVTPLEIVSRKLPSHMAPAHPEWIPGLFMLFRHDVFASIAGFDETRYFMYGEDVDICARLQLAGWNLQVVDHLNALHDARRSSHISLAHFRWHISSLIKWWTSPVFWRFRSRLKVTKINGPLPPI